MIRVRALAVRRQVLDVRGRGSGRRARGRSAATPGRTARVRQRSVHVHVICTKRPLLDRRTVGGADRLVRAEARRSPAPCRGRPTSCRRRPRRSAVIGSPKRWTGGVIEAYAFSGRSVADRADRGRDARQRRRAAGAASRRARRRAATRQAARFMRALLAPSSAGRPSAGTRRGSSPGSCESTATGSMPSVRKRARRASAARSSCSSRSRAASRARQVDRHDAAGARVGVRNRRCRRRPGTSAPRPDPG